jgi:hypothetical protein
MADERRRAPRVAFRNGIVPPRAHLRPGGEVVLVDLSGSGALVEGTFRFRPESRCELAVPLVGHDAALRARVVRSFVARLDRTGPVRYRAALIFEQRVQWPSSVGPDGYRIPEVLAGLDGPGVAATRVARPSGSSPVKTAEFTHERRRR